MPRSRRSPVEQLEDLGLHGDVERGGRLVGDEQLRLGGERDRDHDALAQAAAQLVRIGASSEAAGSGIPTSPSSAIARSFASREVALRWARIVSATWSPDGKHRVETGHRILEDHADPSAAHGAHLGFPECQQIGPVERNAGSVLDSPGRRHQPEEGEAVRLLPQPDSPTSARVSPRAMWKLTPSTG